MIFDILISAAVSAAPALPVQAAAQPTPFAQAAQMNDQALAGATAREDINQIANSEQAASVSESSVSGTVQTGSTTFSDNAFQNVSGLTVVNANTGNNVAINGAITLNVAISPGP
jgi:hypothetical protein